MLPEIIGGKQYERLVVYLNELGYCQTGFNGAIALSWAEIAAWQTLTNTTLTHWEALSVRTLSEHYAAQRHQSTDKACPAPYRPDFDSVSDEQANGDKVVSFFRRLPTVKR